MKTRFPLYAKILLCFFLNLVFLGLVFYGLFKVQLRLDLDSLLLGKAGERIQAVSDLIGAEIADQPREQWSAILERFGAAYQVEFFLFHSDGTQAAGQKVILPPEVAEKLTERRGLGPGGPGGRGGPPFGRGMGRQGGQGAQHAKFMAQTRDPKAYWVGVRMPPPPTERTRPGPLTLLAASPSLAGGGLFFDFKPWVIAGFAALLLSMLFWAPLVRGLTRSVAQMTEATEKISHGDFEARVDANRSDELGALGRGINRMSQRLSGYVTGQKRLLGDIAHELRSPIARMQLALGILEQKIEAQPPGCVEDLREEIQQMSGLVDELLSYSKASLGIEGLSLKPVALAELVERVARRESAAGGEVRNEVAADLWVLAEPELLARAVGNLVRNSIRYAGEAGPITIGAENREDGVQLTVSDCGRGIPEEALEKIFDPFYRVEHSRDRQSGGVGLGLTIVKTCVEACGGRVTCRNRNPSGLETTLELKPVEAEEN